MRTLKKIGVIMFVLGMCSLFLELFYMIVAVFLYGNKTQPEWCLKWLAVSFITALTPVLILILSLLKEIIIDIFDRIDN